MSNSEAPTDKIPFRKLLRIVQSGKSRGKPMFRVAYQGQNWPVWRTFEQLHYNRHEAKICDDYLRDHNPETFQSLSSSESEDESDPKPAVSTSQVDDGKKAPPENGAAKGHAAKHDHKSDNEAEEPPAKKPKK
uniref:Chromo domain-containing protein n=1 Tax=Panagrellus redivivus TaxID=6233 RepID=A0A7E4UYJ3_PANRE